MNFKIACQTHEKITSFEVFGPAANHLDSIARYVRAKVTGPQGVVLDIRAVTTRPAADKVFIHILKYPATICLRKIALVDLNENRRFGSLYERLVRTRGYQARLFSDIAMANEWLLSDDATSKANRSRLGSLIHVPRVLRRSLNPIRSWHNSFSKIFFLKGWRDLWVRLPLVSRVRVRTARSNLASIA